MSYLCQMNIVVLWTDENVMWQLVVHLFASYSFQLVHCGGNTCSCLQHRQQLNWGWSVSVRVTAAPWAMARHCRVVDYSMAEPVGYGAVFEIISLDYVHFRNSQRMIQTDVIHLRYTTRDWVFYDNFLDYDRPSMTIAYCQRRGTVTRKSLQLSQSECQNYWLWQFLGFGHIYRLFWSLYPFSDNMLLS